MTQLANFFLPLFLSLLHFLLDPSVLCVVAISSSDFFVCNFLCVDSTMLAYYLMKPKKKKKKRNYRVVERKVAPLYFVYQQSLHWASTDESFTKLFRFDLETFDLLLHQFGPAYNKIPMSSASLKPRSLRRFFDAGDVLRMILRRLAANVDFDTLALLSGGVPETVGRSVQHGFHVLLAVLEKWTPARVSFPASNEACEELARKCVVYCANRGNVMEGSFIGFLDGSIRPRERPGDDAWQEENCNGKSKKHAMKVLLIQLFDGCYANSAVNFVGTAHDAKIFRSLKLPSLMSHLSSKFVLAGDTAFASSPRIVRPLSSTELSQFSLEECSIIEAASSVLASVRIGGEWCIGGLLQLWALLKAPVPADDLVSGAIRWQLGIQLFNVRVRKMGVGQTHAVYD